jgi:Protein of unknown function (DUF4231)
MTTSETANFERKNQIDMDDTLTKSSSISKKNNFLLLKIIEYFFLASLVCSIIINLVLPDDKRFVIAGVISLAFFIFLFLSNKQYLQTSSNLALELSLKKKAELYLINNADTSAINLMLPARENALRYSQELIDDYKKNRNLSRNLYYALQMLTIVFSGVTPILVLVDKLEAGQTWLKWLPVICPAIASIVASIVTSFPFQKNSVAANTAVELLEAEQEKFILGVTPAYRCYDSLDENEQQQKLKQAIENFIVQVNSIHLNLLQQTGENRPQQDNSQSTQSSNENK